MLINMLSLDTKYLIPAWWQTMASIESLPLLLKQLGLPTIKLHWEEMEVKAQGKKLRYPGYLAELAELEANSRYQNRIARHTKDAKLPPGKTLSSFDFSVPKSLNYQQIMALADNPGWVKDANNLVIFGPSGVGKSHLATAIGYRMVEHGLRCLYMSGMELVQRLQRAKSEFRLAEQIAKLGRIPLLIIDDIGYVKKNESETSVLFELIAERYESASIIITANQPFSEWDSIFPDNMMAVAAVDRLIHHATIINIDEQSFRKQEAEKRR
jgi:DNA replication protein DnaC